jgi:phage gp36-like protein
MTYATQQDLVDRYGESEIVQLSDRARIGSINAAVVAKALDDADSEINGYLEGRYTLPFENPPKLLRLVACDIARFRLAENRATEEIEKRYAAQIKFLSAVAKGDIKLGLNSGGATTPVADAPSSDGSPRTFTRDNLSDFTS